MTKEQFLFIIEYNTKKYFKIFKMQRSNYVEYILQRTGLGESQAIESIMKRVAEMDRTKLIGQYLIPHSKRYLIGVMFFILKHN